MSIAAKGRTPWNKGKDGNRKGIQLSEETKQKMRIAAQNRKNNDRVQNF